MNVADSLEFNACTAYRLLYVIAGPYEGVESIEDDGPVLDSQPDGCMLSAPSDDSTLIRVRRFAGSSREQYAGMCDIEVREGHVRIGNFLAPPIVTMELPNGQYRLGVNPLSEPPTLNIDLWPITS